MIRKGSIVSCLALLVCAHLAGPVYAQFNGLDANDARPAMVCFYECQLDSTGRLWRETTGLVLTNPFGALAADATIHFFDGNQNPQGCTTTHLSAFDLDTINVCETLDAGLGTGFRPPASGLIYTVFEYSDDTPVVEEQLEEGFFDLTAAPGWVKNFLGSFIRVEIASRTLNPAVIVEPHNGKLESIGKTQCQLVWFHAPEPPECETLFPPVYIEGTGNDVNGTQ